MMKTANNYLGYCAACHRPFYTKSFDIICQHYKVMEGLFNSAVACWCYEKAAAAKVIDKYTACN